MAESTFVHDQGHNQGGRTRRIALRLDAEPPAFPRIVPLTHLQTKLAEEPALRLDAADWQGLELKRQQLSG